MAKVASRQVLCRFCERDPRGEAGPGLSPRRWCRGDKAAGWDGDGGPASQRRASAGRKPIPKSLCQPGMVLSPPNPQALSWLLHFGVRALLPVPGKLPEEAPT